MGIVFNAEEIYQIGVEIEINGEKFYKTAASSVKDAGLKRMFDELAAWEKEHITLFEQLKNNLPQGTSGLEPLDPDAQKNAYLKAIADGHVFIMNKDVKGMVSACGDAVDILKLAMNFEKDSVVLYATMKDIVPPRLGRDTIERLVSEESRHVAMLQQKLAVLGE